MPCFGRGQARLGEHAPERAAVLGQVDRLGLRAEHRHAGVLEPLRQAERRLAAERADHPGDRAGLLLGVHDLEDVLEGQRLEVQPVGRVVVGRHRLGIAVHHHGLEAGVAQRHHRMHARVVELDALTDPVRPAAEDDHLLALALRRHLGLLVVGRVVVRRGRRELGGAGVDGLEHRSDAEPVAQGAHAVLAGEFGTQRRDLPVGQAVPFRLAQQRFVERRRVLDLSADLDDQRELVEEPRIDAGRPRRPGRHSRRRSAPRRPSRAGRRSGRPPGRATPRAGGRRAGRSRSRRPWSPSTAVPCRTPR